VHFYLSASKNTWLLKVVCTSGKIGRRF